MIPVSEAKTFCLYCRGELPKQVHEDLVPSSRKQYHQGCFEEIIKDNKCEYCSNILNELNQFFTEEKVKIHQQCRNALEESIIVTITSSVTDYLTILPLKRLAKEIFYYEMKEDTFSTYIEELYDEINSQLPNIADKSDNYQLFTNKQTKEIIKKLIAEYVKNKLKIELNLEIQKCRTTTKQEIVNKVVHFVWNYYLEIPISYKNSLHTCFSQN